MKELENAKTLLQGLEEKKLTLCKSLKESYGLDYIREYSPETATGYYCDIRDGLYECQADWRDIRDLDYIFESQLYQELFIGVLEKLSANDKSIYDDNGIINSIILRARIHKENLQDDIKKAQKEIELVDSILAVCEQFKGNNNNK